MIKNNIILPILFALVLSIPMSSAFGATITTIENGNIDTGSPNTSFGGVPVGDVFRSTLGLNVTGFEGDMIKIARITFRGGEGSVGHNTTVHLYDQSLNLLATSNQVTTPQISGSTTFLANFTFNHIIGSGNTTIHVALQFDNNSGEVITTTNDSGISKFRDTGNTYPTPPNPFVDDFLQASNTAMWTEMDIMAGADTTPPVITTTATEPIIILRNSVFDEFEFVTCIDDMDGDITNTMSTVGTVDTSKARSYLVDYTCTDNATNSATLTVQYLVKRPSTGSGGQAPSAPAPSAPAPSGDGDGTALLQVTGDGIDRAFNLFDALNELFAPMEPAPTVPTAPIAPTPEPDQRISFVDRIRDFFSDLFG